MIVVFIKEIREEGKMKKEGGPWVVPT